MYQHDDERSYVINRTGLVPDFRGARLFASGSGHDQGHGQAESPGAP